MARDNDMGITEISGQLATRMPTKGVPESEVKEAIRNTLHYAEKAGILGDLANTIEAQGAGDTEVGQMVEALRRR